jgi:nucleotide-binding universal stress UspA family protein
VAAKEAALRGAVLTVLTVGHRPPGDEPEAEEIARKNAEAVAVQGAERAAELRPGLRVTAQAVVGSAGRVLAQAGRGADLLVLGRRGGGGFPGMLLGSTSMRAVGGTCSPVIVVPGTAGGSTSTSADASTNPSADASTNTSADASPNPNPENRSTAREHRVVAAVDIDERCDDTLRFALAEADRRGVGLTVLHVWDEPWITAYGQGDPAAVAEAAAIEHERADRLAALVHAAHRDWPGVEVFQQVATGSAPALLVAVSGHSGLLVTGARRHGEGEHGMVVGPVTQTLLRHAECPVAVVPEG